MPPLMTLCRMILLSVCLLVCAVIEAPGAEPDGADSISASLLPTLSPDASPLLNGLPRVPRTPSLLADDTLTPLFQLEAVPEETWPLPRAQKRYGRAALEVTAALGGAALHYWTSRAFAADFDRAVNLETLHNKFSGEFIRFDDNPISTNSFPGHPLSGAYYYLVARNQHLSRLESFLTSALASSVHEFFIEFPEVVSISDMITTPVAGSTIGESLLTLGRYFRCGPRRQTTLYTVLAFIIDPVHVADRWLWRERQDERGPASLCAEQPTGQAFSLLAGMSVTEHDQTDDMAIGFLVGFSSKLYQLPQYGQPGSFSGFVGETSLTETGLEILSTGRNLESLRFLTKTVWSAYYSQHLSRNLAGQRTGLSVFAGLASGFEHTQYDTGTFVDWIGAVHLLGPALEVLLVQDENYLRLGLEVFGDFAMIRAFAFEKYKQQHSTLGIKSVLRKENYYYATGIHIHPKLEGQYGAYRLILEYRYGYYDSIEGSSRRPVSRDFNLIDRQEEYSVTLGRRLDFLTGKLWQDAPLWIEAEWRRIARQGFIEEDDVRHAGGTSWLLLRFRMPL
ncbi:MAG: DUF3943 domain-containing protein [Candidatus Tectimicrobiota bacterium]